MLSVLVPGLGEVEVENEESLKMLQDILNNHLAKHRKKPSEAPNKLLEAIEGLSESNRGIAQELKNIKPEVTVEAPVVNIDPPVVKVPDIIVPETKLPEFPEIVLEANEPITKVSVTNIERDSKGMIETCDFEVIRG